DGLRADFEATMPALSRLADGGVNRVLRAEFPSYTYASLTTFVTGIPPFYSGIRLNRGRVTHRYDTLLGSAERAHIPVVVGANKWKIFAHALDAAHESSVTILPVGTPGPRPERRELFFYHFDDVDHAGHRHGARSPQYREATLRADALIETIAAQLDPERDVL